MSRKNILIIDDDPLFRISARNFLESEGFSVSCCENVFCASELIIKKRIEIILVDYQMPVMNGEEAVRQLRKSCPDAFIIGISSGCKERAFMRAGANAFVYKDRLIDQVVSLINSGVSSAG